MYKHFGEDKDSIIYKRLILSHNKHRCHGDFLVDDRPKHGAKDFSGEWIEFKPDSMNELQRVKEYLMSKI